jgi:hypothetical protein
MILEDLPCAMGVEFPDPCSLISTFLASATGERDPHHTMEYERFVPSKLEE